MLTEPPTGCSSRPHRPPQESHRMRRLVILAAIAFVALLLSRQFAAAEEVKFQLTIEAGKYDRVNTPVMVPINIPQSIVLASKWCGLKTDDGRVIDCQLTPPGLGHMSASTRTDPNVQPCEVHFILPKLRAGASLRLVGALIPTDPAPEVKPLGFNWMDDHKGRIKLFWEDQPVMDYMDAPYDNSTKANRDRTFKVYDHLYDPDDGKRLVTKGPGGLYTHHRGLFYGFQRVSYSPGGATRVNIWECPNAHQSHEGVLTSEAGTVLARHLLAIDWHGPEKSTGSIGPVFAHEQREMTVYLVPHATMIDFVSLLRTGDVGPVHLDGDPQHAGFHFRAAQEVASNTHKETIFIRPDGVGKPGETRNWAAPPKKSDPNCVDLPWKGMSFVLGDQRYTAAILDRPDNPKPARSSERDYGRFGSYFSYDVTKDHPLLVHYRFWLERGQATPEQIAALANDFVDPVKTTVKMN